MQARPPNHGFHETRNTRHESQLLRPPEPPRPPTSRCFSVHDCSLLFGIVQQKILPLSQCPLFVHIGNAACKVFTKHESRNTVFPVPAATPMRATPSPTNGFFTRHETRNTNHGLYASLPTISHYFPRFPGISRPPHPPPPIKCPRAVRLSWSAARDCRAARLLLPARCGAVMERHERHIAPEPVSAARRQPQLPPPSGFVPLRRTPNATMLRKRNVMDCVDGSCVCIDTLEGRAYHIVSFVHLGGRS